MDHSKAKNKIRRSDITRSPGIATATTRKPALFDAGSLSHELGFSGRVFKIKPNLGFFFLLFDSNGLFFFV